MSRATFRILFAPLVAVALLLGLSTGASAHDQLLSTTPAAKSTVSAPTSVSLKFSATVLKVGSEIRVTGPGGVVNDGALVVAGPVVSQNLTTGLRPGAYSVAWRVTSQDGHPISGTFGFTVTGASKSAAASSGSASRTASASSSTASVPPQQVPTNETNNAPWVIVGLVALAAAIIGVGVVISRRRMSND